MATGGKDRTSRAERERARLYQARKTYHEGLSRRRRRDNLIAGVAGGLLVAGIVSAQVAYFAVGPGVPAPTPAQSTTPAPAPTETTPPATPEPESSTPAAESPAPSPTSTPADQ